MSILIYVAEVYDTNILNFKRVGQYFKTKKTRKQNDYIYM